MSTVEPDVGSSGYLLAAIDRVLAHVGGFGAPATHEDCAAVRAMIVADIAPAIAKYPSLRVEVYHRYVDAILSVYDGGALVARRVVAVLGGMPPVRTEPL